MNIEELKKIVIGNGFQESHGSTTMVIDVETVIDLLDELKQCDIPVVVKSFYCGADENHNAGRCKNQCRLCSIDEKKK